MYIIHLKPDQPEALSEAMKGVGPQNGHQALYSHPTNLHGGEFRFVKCLVTS